jgi:hypothetical protein
VAGRTVHTRARAQATSGRELAVLDGGPWSGCWYWRDDLDGVRDAATRFPADHPAGQMAHYQPTREHRDNPEGIGPGRVWRYQPRPTGDPQ